MTDASTAQDTADCPARPRRPRGMSHAGASVAKTDAVVVEVKDLVAGYLPGVNILNGANLIARKGELIGIIGPNGAGKSTLLKAIFGMVKVRGGEITVNGESVVGLKSDKLVAARGRLRAAEQQRVPLAHDRGEPADGALPGTRRPTTSGSSS